MKKTITNKKKRYDREKINKKSILEFKKVEKKK